MARKRITRPISIDTPTIDNKIVNRYKELHNMDTREAWGKFKEFTKLHIPMQRLQMEYGN